MNSRDAANTVFQASALDARCKWTRDPATAGAGGSVLRNARRSILPAGRPGAVESVSLPSPPETNKLPAGFARSALFRGG